MEILKFKKIYLIISATAVALSIFSIAFFGLNLSIDFKGGTVYEISYIENIPEIEKVKESVKKSGLELAVVQKVGESDFVIKAENFTDNIKKDLKLNLTFDDQFTFTEKKIKTIGPSVSSELATKSLFAILFVSIMIVLFIKFVFRSVSKPVSSTKYGLVAVVALIHDIIIPTGVFAALGSFSVGYQIDVLFVTALLAILGFSVNDTIVVFDRIRENLKNSEAARGKNVSGQNFEEIVGKSLNETITRSANTSLTTLFVLASLYFIGGEVLEPFALVLMLGVVIGTYSSIFLASPLLVFIEKTQKQPKEEKEKEIKEAEYVATEKDIADALERMRNEK
jgi:preprotein translocase subunit SecF